jgi:hypothetical protein
MPYTLILRQHRPAHECGLETERASGSVYQVAIPRSWSIYAISHNVIFGGGSVSIRVAAMFGSSERNQPSLTSGTSNRSSGMRLILLQTREQVATLSPAACRLMQQVVATPDATCMPEYFLPRLPDSAVPRVVATYEGDELAGILYTYEMRVCGLHTGFVFGGDQMGRGLLVCAAHRESEMLSAACNFLMEKGIHAMRMDWTPTRTLDAPPHLL